jgi:hypothetical protein
MYVGLDDNGRAQRPIFFSKILLRRGATMGATRAHVLGGGFRAMVETIREAIDFSKKKNWNHA